MFGSILGSVIGGIGGILANRESAKSAARSIGFQRETMRNRYQWMVDDLQKAGLNPILATGLNAGTASGAQYTAQNVGAAAIQAASAKQSMSLAARQQDNNDKIADSMVNLNNAKAAKATQDTADVARKLGVGFWEGQVSQLGASAKQSQASAANLQAQAVKAGHEIQHIGRQIMQAEASIREMNQRIAESKSRQARMSLQNKLDASKKFLNDQELIIKNLVQEKLYYDLQLVKNDLPASESLAQYHKSLGGKVFERYVKPYIQGTVGSLLGITAGSMLRRSK